jgi:hypothetical protein
MPVLFSWSKGGIEQKGGGFTRDVSPEGAYILYESDQYPLPGASVKIEMMLPPIDAEAHAAKLRSKGAAVRTSCPGEERGFAVAAVFTMHDTAESKRLDSRGTDLRS